MSRTGRWLLAAVLAICAAWIVASPTFAGDGERSRITPREPLEVQTDPYIYVPPEARQLSEGRRLGFGRYVSVQANVDADGFNILGDAANEPSIAIDPTNRLRMVIAWRQFDTILSNFRQAGWAYTQDGGQTWHFPGVIEPGVFRSDPVVDVNASGKFEFDSLTADTAYSTTVFHSTDGGASWDAGHYSWGGDKEWLVIDRTGGPGHNNVYSNWTYYTSECNGGFTRSTDDGNTFEPCTYVDGYPQWGTMAIGPDGAVYIAGYGYSNSTMLLAKSVNAQFAGQTPYWTYQFVDLAGMINYGQGPNPGGLLGQVNVCLDNSTNPTRGNVYMLCSVAWNGTGKTQVKFARSTDGGTTWSKSVRVNDDADPFGLWHWFGTMSVAPNGRIDAIWYDTRNHPGTFLSELFHSYSEDAGASWSRNVQVSPTFDPKLGYPNQFKIGDYIGMVSSNAGAHVAYSATFNGEQDVYYVFIPRYEHGDMNCDDLINNQDIDGFVEALLEPTLYGALNPNCDILNGDFSGDGTVNNQDIDAFAAALLAPTSRKGDLNCDGSVNSQDIDPFVLAMFFPAVYTQQFPDCALLQADFDGNGLINSQDIDGFVSALLGS